jgi:hypothetical protein
VAHRCTLDHSFSLLELCGKAVIMGGEAHQVETGAPHLSAHHFYEWREPDGHSHTTQGAPSSKAAGGAHLRPLPGDCTGANVGRNLQSVQGRTRVRPNSLEKWSGREDSTRR